MFIISGYWPKSALYLSSCQRRNKLLKRWSLLWLQLSTTTTTTSRVLPAMLSYIDPALQQSRTTEKRISETQSDNGRTREDSVRRRRHTTVGILCRRSWCSFAWSLFWGGGNGWPFLVKSLVWLKFNWVEESRKEGGKIHGNRFSAIDNNLEKQAQTGASCLDLWCERE